MSWRDRLQAGKFRDAAFHTEEAKGKLGRRVAVHEYPKKEEHYPEDMGNKVEADTLVLFVVGDDYDLARDKLFKALKKPGSGTLVHPYLGTLQIQVVDVDWVISSKKGGYCQFTVEYVRAGKRKYPTAASANTKAVERAADDAVAALKNQFEKSFSVDKAPEFVKQSAVSHLQEATDFLQKLNGSIVSKTQFLTDLSTQISSFSQQVQTLVLQPHRIASQVEAIVVSAIGGVNSVKVALKRYHIAPLVSLNSDEPILSATTPTTTATTTSRQREQDNQAATAQLLSGLVTVETARKISTESAPFATVDEALTSRDTLLANIDVLIDNGSDDEYDALTSLQTAIVRRVEEIEPSLQRVNTIQLQESMPAVVLAHTLYGDANRADELIQRNRVTHPVFVPAGKTLEVLSHG